MTSYGKPNKVPVVEACAQAMGYTIVDVFAGFISDAAAEPGLRLRPCHAIFGRNARSLYARTIARPTLGKKQPQRRCQHSSLGSRPPKNPGALRTRRGFLSAPRKTELACDHP
jgi:hypothetical protein